MAFGRIVHALPLLRMAAAPGAIVAWASARAPDSATRLRTAAAAWALMVGFASGLAHLLLARDAPALREVTYVVIASVVLHPVLLWTLRYFRSPAPVAIAYSFIGILLTAGGALFLGVLTASMGAWMAVMTLVVAFLKGPKWAAGHGAATVASLIALKLWGLPQVPPESTAEHVNSWLTVVATAGSAAMLVVFSWAYEAAVERAGRRLQRSYELIRDREAKLASLVDHNADGVVAVDPKGNVLAANRAAEGLFSRWSGNPVASGAIMPLIPASWRTLWRVALDKTREGLPNVSLAPILDPEGRSFEIQLNPIRDGHETHGSTIVIRDVTQRIRDQDRQANLNRRLIEASRKAGQAEIASGVLHNVGNVLNSLNIGVHELSRSTERLRVDYALEAVNRVATAMQSTGTRDATTDRLLLYLRKFAQQAGGLRDNVLRDTEDLTRHVEHMRSVIHSQQSMAKTSTLLENVQVQDLLDDVRLMTRLEHGTNGIAFSIGGDVAATIVADRHKVVQIIVNLVRNAAQALQQCSPWERILHIRVEVDDEEVRLCVIDTATGIAEDDLRRLFQHGFTTKADGHGFGLHASANAARDMGGSLQCESAGEGSGSVFTLTLPRSGAGVDTVDHSLNPDASAA